MPSPGPSVGAEDTRLRILLHDSNRMFQPRVIPVRTALPTLVLPARKAPYTAASLVQYGAPVLRPDGTGLLTGSVSVAAGAELSLGGPSLRGGSASLGNGKAGITVRGKTSHLAGADNVLSWTGFRSLHGLTCASIHLPSCG